MLSQRIVTAVVLATLLLGSLYSGKPALLALLLGAFVGVAAWEWAGLAGCGGTVSRVLYAIIVSVPLVAIQLSLNTPWSAGIVWSGTVWWCLAMVMVFYYQAGGQTVPAFRPAIYVMGFLVLVPAWTGLMDLYMHQYGLHLLLLFFVMIWLVDSTAFFAGRRWGRRKLAMRISPGKTWEGFIAGILVSIVPGVIYIVYENITGPAGFWLILLCVICAIFSALGDLFVSILKRRASVKDSSRLLPGHGGVLDRIDGITAAAPVFTTGIWILGSRL